MLERDFKYDASVCDLRVKKDTSSVESLGANDDHDGDNRTPRDASR